MTRVQVRQVGTSKLSDFAFGVRLRSGGRCSAKAHQIIDVTSHRIKAPRQNIARLLERPEKAIMCARFPEKFV